MWGSLMLNVICGAIAKMQVVTFGYKGKVRTVEPHTLGYDTKGHLTLCGWQLSGGSGQDWRDFHTNEMTGLSVMDEEFAGPRDGYKRDDRTLQQIVCQL